jgi:Glycosyl hydrolase family 71
MRLARPAAAAVVALGALAVLACGTVATSTAPGEEPPLTFDMPSAATLDDAAPRVFANYFPTFPISLDNEDPSDDYYARGFNAADGEGGNHAAYGGFFRQRPLPRAVDPSDDWALEDMKTEVQRATDAGIDGFVIDILSLSGPVWNRVLLLLDAASIVDPEFRIVLMPDGNTRVVSDPVVLADAMASIADHPAVHHLDDGRLVVAPFMPEGAQWWADWMALMAERGISVAFMPVLLDYGRSIDDFAAISYGVSVWGGRSLDSVDNLARFAADAQGRGLVWMQPVALQDVRPKSGVYDEANNTETLRAMWSTAEATDADWVQIVTWNDYSEATEIAPSTNTGWSPLDINAYYLVSYKLGAAPTITRDRIYLSHRIQPVAAEPTDGQTSLMKLRTGSSPPRDGVEVLTFLRQGAAVEVTIGRSTHRYDAPAGVHAEVFPLEVGTVAARARAADGTETTVTSSHEVTDGPKVQDLQYRFANSGRDERSLSVPPTVPASSAPATEGSNVADASVPTDDGSSTSVAVVAVGAVGAVLAVVAVVAVVIGQARRNSPRLTRPSEPSKGSGT